MQLNNNLEEYVRVCDELGAALAEKTCSSCKPRKRTAGEALDKENKSALANSKVRQVATSESIQFGLNESIVREQ